MSIQQAARRATAAIPMARTRAGAIQAGLCSGAPAVRGFVWQQPSAAPYVQCAVQCTLCPAPYVLNPMSNVAKHVRNPKLGFRRVWLEKEFVEWQRRRPCNASPFIKFSE